MELHLHSLTGRFEIGDRLSATMVAIAAEESEAARELADVVEYLHDVANKLALLKFNLSRVAAMSEQVDYSAVRTEIQNLKNAIGNEIGEINNKLSEMEAKIPSGSDLAQDVKELRDMTAAVQNIITTGAPGGGEGGGGTGEGGGTGGEGTNAGGPRQPGQKR